MRAADEKLTINELGPNRDKRGFQQQLQWWHSGGVSGLWSGWYWFESCQCSFIAVFFRAFFAKIFLSFSAGSIALEKVVRLPDQ
jgi:hypothetical protein